VKHFAILNMLLALVWLWVAWQISRYYTDQEKLVSSNLPPRLFHRIEDHTVVPGTRFSFCLPEDTFVDPDEGDVLTITAHGLEVDELPDWLDFDPENLGFSGFPPVDIGDETRLVLRATDFDGAWAQGELVLRHPSGAGQIT
jgi:hypothetical protein